MDQDSAHMVATSKVPMLKPEMPITSTEEKDQRRLEVKSRSTLMIGIPNEHQLKFNSIKDAKKLLEAVKKRFGGNATTRKNQRNLLKQQYENFIAPRSEMLDQTFDRLQKLRNKADLDTMSMDDLYNNLKGYEPEVKGMSSSISAANSTNIDNVSDVVICAFFACQPNSPQLIHEDLQQIYPDDMEEIDLRWQMAMLTMRARRFSKNTRKKLTVNGNETISFDKSKVECFNCHKKGHFARECRAPRNQDNKNKESSRRSVPSDQAKEGPSYALMAFLSSSSDSEGNPYMDLQDQGVIDSGCSKHITRNMSYLIDFEEINGGYVAFKGNPKGGKITRKARTPQQNGVAKRRIRTLTEAARTMLVDSKLPTTFWAEAVSTACYVQNRVLVVKPHNKTVCELFHGKTPTLSFMRPFRCPVTILNTIDHLGKFNGKANEGFFVGYSLNSKAFRVFNSRTRIVEENLHIRFSENTPNVVGNGPDWLFDIDALRRIMNYESIVTDPKSPHDDGSKPSSDNGKKVDEDLRKESECYDQEKEDNVNNTNNVNAAGTNEVNAVSENISIKLPFDPKMPALEDDSIFDFTSDDENDGTMADMNNLDTII
ncbi:retrovirus-related pol polyprotein from transposon TNT 1-94 [Tanacetum coccineum]